MESEYLPAVMRVEPVDQFLFEANLLMSMGLPLKQADQLAYLRRLSRVYHLALADKAQKTKLERWLAKLLSN